MRESIQPAKLNLRPGKGAHRTEHGVSWCGEIIEKSILTPDI